MRTLILKIEYNGRNYAGWQRQKNALTIQEVIENALEKLFKNKTGIIAAGRTDSGVHAAGQIASGFIKDDINLSEKKLLMALNSILPKDIRICSTKIIEEKFHARFDANAREYNYYLTTKDSVFLKNFYSFCKYKINEYILFESAKIFKGKYDFTTFSKWNPDTTNYNCEVEISEWNKIQNGVWKYTIKADHFVYGMVRSIVGAMLDAARGKRSLEDLEISLYSQNRELSSPAAKAEGLILEKIYYPENLTFF